LSNALSFGKNAQVWVNSKLEERNEYGKTVLATEENDYLVFYFLKKIVYAKHLNNCIVIFTYIQITQVMNEGVFLTLYFIYEQI
jgi:hypothetical protein